MNANRRRRISVGRYPNHQECVRQNVSIDSNGCWNWLGAVHRRQGYGSVCPEGKVVPAHRFSYEAFVGAISEGLHLDHLCRNRGCVNPEHLEPVSCRENIMRSPVSLAAQNVVKSHCRAGHPYSPENTYVNPKGERACRTCVRAHHARYRAARAAERAS